MLRGRSFAMALLLLGTMGICAAQEAADILVGNEIVARVRTAASYDSVEHRAAAIDENINTVLATTDDPASLEVSLEQVDGLWTVLIDGTAIMAVHPAEAEANAMSPEMLGASWVRRFKDALPGAMTATVTEIGEPPAEAAEAAVEPAPEPAADPVQPLTIADEPVISSPTAGDGPARTQVTPLTEAAPEVAQAPEAEEAVEAPAEETVTILDAPAENGGDPEEIVAGQGARLLMLEAFNKARELPEDDYLVRREAMAAELFDNLVQVMTGGRATGRLDPGTAVAAPRSPEPLETPVEIPEADRPATVPETTIDTGPIAVEPEPAPGPATLAAAPALEMSPESRAKINAQIPAGDPSYANAVQKVAIRAKFKAATDAFRAAQTDAPATAAQARELLTAARSANNDNNFDAAERYLDTALALLGVTQWEQHIDSAMRDLGITG